MQKYRKCPTLNNRNNFLSGNRTVQDCLHCLLRIKPYLFLQQLFLSHPLPFPLLSLTHIKTLNALVINDEICVYESFQEEIPLYNFRY